MAALLILAGALLGLVLGWYLRRINTWCPECGDGMICPSCTRVPRSARRVLD